MKLLLFLSLFLPFTLAYGQKHPFASDISVRGIQSRPMTTVERTLAGTFLGASDEAFLVYDSDDGDYYWWDGAAWQTLGGGGGVPGGADTELQYNAAGVFGGMDNFVRNATTGLLTYSPTLDEATGDENGLHVDLTANKATSGTWTGIAVDMADGSGVGSPEFPNLAFRAAYEGDDVFAVDQEGRVRAGFPGAGLLVNARDGFAAPPAPWIPSFFTYFGQTNWYDDNSDVIRFFSSAGDMYLRNNAVLYWSSTAVAPGPSQLSRLNKDGWVASRIAAAGNEIGFNNIITINKLAGNYTGLQVAVTETAAPGTDNRLLNLVSGGNSMAHFDGFGSMFLRERVAAGTTKAGYGQLWTKNTTPAELWFTDDAGGDFQLGVGGAPGGADTQLQYNNAGAFGGIANATWNGTTLGLTAPVTLAGVVGQKALTITGATQTTSQPLLDLAQTWNAAGTTFTAVKVSVTNTASAAGSLLLDLTADGGATSFQVKKDGTALFDMGTDSTQQLNINKHSGGFPQISAVGSFFYLNAAQSVVSTVGGVNSFLSDGSGVILYNPAIRFGGSSQDLKLYRAAADVLRQARTTNPQAYELYNTTDSDTAPVNYERWATRWTGNVLVVGTSASGTGVERPVSWTTAASIVTDAAPNDDTTLKKWSIQRLAAPPTNAAYIPFTNSPGSPTNIFYLVLEEG